MSLEYIWMVDDFLLVTVNSKTVLHTPMMPLALFDCSEQVSKKNPGF